MVHLLFSLLDVGPTAEGDIITPMADNLLAAGRWLKYAGDCVYATVRILCACYETCVLSTATGLLVPSITGSFRIVPIPNYSRNVLYRRFQLTH